jgi:CubicO group peptidase (beta-lactamase class C family)
MAKGLVSNVPMSASVKMASVDSDIDLWAHERMARDHIPGMVIGIYQYGKVIKRKAYGRINLEKDLPTKIDSRFEICSITKQFAVVGLLLLAEDGKLSLDEPITKYFPGAPAAYPPGSGVGKSPKTSWGTITIRDLLYHLSGLGDGMGDLRDLGKSYSDALTVFLQTVPKRRSHTRWEYNNSAYEILQQIAEMASGEPFWLMMQRRVFARLGMSHTYPGHRGATGVQGYLWQGGAFKMQPALVTAYGNTDGILVSTVDDLNLYSEALFQGTLINDKSRREMLTPGRLRSGEIACTSMSDGYGLGVFLSTVEGSRIEKHSGSYLDSSSQLTRLLDDHLTIVVLTNRGKLSERPWWGEQLGELVTKRRLLPRFNPIEDPDPSRLARVRKLAQAAGYRPGEELGNLRSLRLIRAVKQGSETYLEYRAEFDRPQIVSLFQSGDQLSEPTIAELPLSSRP